MAPLIVFLAFDEDELNKIQKIMNHKYHNLIVLSNNKLKKFVDKKTKAIIFDFVNCTGPHLIKTIISYTDAFYTHYYLIKNINLDYEKYLDEIDFFSNNEILIFSKIYFIFNDMKLEVNLNIIENPYEHFEAMDQALSGIAVENKYFLLALDELLPEARYEILCELEESILNLLRNKNKNSNNQYYIVNEKKDGVKNQIVFTPSQEDSYKYIIKRTDGLNCYIL